MDKISGGGEEVKAMNIVVKGFRTDGNIRMHVLGDVDSDAGRHLGATDGRMKETDVGVMGGDLRSGPRAERAKQEASWAWSEE